MVSGARDRDGRGRRLRLRAARFPVPAHRRRPALAGPSRRGGRQDRLHEALFGALSGFRPAGRGRGGPPRPAPGRRPVRRFPWCAAAGVLPPEQGADSRFGSAGRAAADRQDGPGDRRAERRPPQPGGADEERPGGRRPGGARRAGGRLGPPAGGGKEARRGDPLLPSRRQGRSLGREQLRPPGLAAARPGRHRRRAPEEHRRGGSGRPGPRRQQPVVGEGPPDALALPPRVRPAGRARPERPGEAAGGPGGGRGRGRGARLGGRGRGRADRQGGRGGAPGEGRPQPPRPGLRVPATGAEIAGDAGVPRRVGHGRVRPALAPGHAAPERPQAGGRREQDRGSGANDRPPPQDARPAGRRRLPGGAAADSEAGMGAGRRAAGAYASGAGVAAGPRRPARPDGPGFGSVLRGAGGVAASRGRVSARAGLGPEPAGGAGRAGRGAADAGPLRRGAGQSHAGGGRQPPAGQSVAGGRAAGDPAPAAGGQTRLCEGRGRH